MKPVIWLIGGTSEGRRLIKELADLSVQLYVSVATEYGASLIEPQDNTIVMAERMDLAAMKAFLKEKQPEYVVDATHPYAVEVSANIRKACEEAGCEYIRLLRSSVQTGEEEEMVCVESVEAAVEFLKETEGNILVTTGSKELHKYTAIPAFEERVFARVLSTPEVARHCADLGFTGKHLICMKFLRSQIYKNFF